MKRFLTALISLSLIFVMLLGLASCDLITGGKGPEDEPECQHRDADDNSLCDKCGEVYTDGKDIEDEPECQHRDAEDNSLCDECGEAYADGKDIEDKPECQHRDADDNSLCDECGEAYADGKDIEDKPECQHRDADDNSLCDECGEAYTDGKDVEDEPECQHRDADDNSLCDECGADYSDGDEPSDEPVCQHRDRNDDSRCDECSEKYLDGIDVYTGDCEHSFLEWSVYSEPTCTAEGERIRSCEICRVIETEPIEVIGHRLTSVQESFDTDGATLITAVCTMCGTAGGNTYKGYYVEGTGMHLLDTAVDFSFDVYCEAGIEGILDKITVAELFWSEAVAYECPEGRESLEVTELGNSVYRITPSSTYRENTSYCVLISEDVSFTDIVGQTFVFSTDGEEVYNVAMNSDIIFLKSMAEACGIDFAYSCEYTETDEYGECYVLSLSSAYGFDTSYVGKLICIGDCSSFDEAECLPLGEAMIGKVAYVHTEGELQYLILTVPSVDEIYDEIEIHGGSIPELDESAIDEESREILVRKVMRSEDFAAAIAAANIAARNYAADNGLYADVIEEEFKADDFDIKITAEKAASGAIVSVTISYTHVIPIREGDIPLGNVQFTIEFVNSYQLEIDVDSNFDELLSGEIKKKGLNLSCTVVNTISSTFDIGATLSMSYTTDEEAYFVINKNTGKIHSTTCRHCPGVLDDNYIVARYFELSLYVDDISANECKVCKPLSMDDSAFAINDSSGMIHCINCMYVVNGTPSSYYVVAAYPAGYTGENCTACRPEEHVKTLDEYLTESVEDGSYYEMFDSLRRLLGDKTSTGQASAIDDDTKARITINLYCFEIPIFVEPEIDFKLKAEFSLHYELTVKNTIFVALVHGDDGYRIIGSCDVTIPKDDIKVDITGSIRAEIGLLSEVRLGVRYISRHVYIGISGAAGMYVDVKGVYHLDSALGEQYYAARFEVGYYTEVRCTYKIIGILRADSFAIIDKSYTPIFNSGDDRIYNRFDSYNDSITVKNVKNYYLDNHLLKVTYFDLCELQNKVGYLSWAEKKQYGFECTFTDESGAEIDYISFKDGMIVISDGAPESFTAYMTVSVYDRVVPSTLIEYIGKSNKGGCAVFLDSKTIEINYSYVDTTEEMERWLGIYEGYYEVGEELFGGMVYRRSIMGIHRVSELYSDEETLAFYAKLASYVKVDDNGNPLEVYTVERLKELLLALPHEYVFMKYSSPGNGSFDSAVEMSATGAYYDGGIALNANNDYYIESNAGGYVSMVVDEYVEGKGFSGSVYSDGGEERIGVFEMLRTELNPYSDDTEE